MPDGTETKLLPCWICSRIQACVVDELMNPVHSAVVPSCAESAAYTTDEAAKTDASAGFQRAAGFFGGRAEITLRARTSKPLRRLFTLRFIF
jgi:hypothetical protein